MKTAQEIRTRIQKNQIMEEEHIVNWVKSLISEVTDLMYLKFRCSYEISLSAEDYPKFEKALELERVKKLLDGFKVMGDGNSKMIISLE